MKTRKNAEKTLGFHLESHIQNITLLTRIYNYFENQIEYQLDPKTFSTRDVLNIQLKKIPMDSIAFFEVSL